MKLYDNWKDIVRRAWSVRFMIIAGLLSGAEVALPYFQGVLPSGTFAALSGIFVGAAFVARLVAQKEL